LQGARVGFVGFGHISRRSWQLFQPFDCVGAAVTGSGTLDAAAEGLAWAADVGGLDRLMVDSEVVVVSAPLTERTVGMS
jgi:phosphoglycerate dehydrogenase-like enzyme